MWGGLLGRIFRTGGLRVVLASCWDRGDARLPPQLAHLLLTIGTFDTVGVTQFAAEVSRRYNLSIMMRILRKHRQWLMIVIAILAIPFIFYFVQRPDYGAISKDQFARIYCRPVSIVRARPDARLCQLARSLGLPTILHALSFVA